MSSLWNVKVLEKKDTIIKLQVKEIHADAGPFPIDPVCAMQLVTNSAYAFNEKYERIPCSPLGEEFRFDKSYLPSDLSGVYCKYIKDIKISSAKNLRNEDAIFSNILEELEKRGISDTDKEWDVEYETAYQEYFQNENHIPIAEYKIVVTDSKWIAHLSSGDSFSSAAFSETGPFIEEEI